MKKIFICFFTIIFSILLFINVNAARYDHVMSDPRITNYVFPLNDDPFTSLSSIKVVGSSIDDVFSHFPITSFPFNYYNELTDHTYVSNYDHQNLINYFETVPSEFQGKFVVFTRSGEKSNIFIYSFLYDTREAVITFDSGKYSLVSSNGLNTKIHYIRQDITVTYNSFDNGVLYLLGDSYGNDDFSVLRSGFVINSNDSYSVLKVMSSCDIYNVDGDVVIEHEKSDFEVTERPELSLDMDPSVEIVGKRENWTESVDWQDLVVDMPHLTNNEYGVILPVISTANGSFKENLENAVFCPVESKDHLRVVFDQNFLNYDESFLYTDFEGLADTFIYSSLKERGFIPFKTLYDNFTDFIDKGIITVYDVRGNTPYYFVTKDRSTVIHWKWENVKMESSQIATDSFMIQVS